MTFRIFARLSAAAFAFALAVAGADEPARLPVDMPAAAAAAVRAEMLAKLNALHRVHTALAAGQPMEAAETAERHLGMSAMGQHAALPPEARPGRYLPEAMMAIGRQSHRHGSELAAALKAGDRPRIDAALRDVTATCVACHSAYRLQ